MKNYFLPKLLIVLFVLSSLNRISYAQEKVFPEKSDLDLRVSIGLGPFMYDQKVEGGGYYIDGRGYDLTWYGLLQLQITGEIQYFVSEKVGLGIGGAFFIAPNPYAVDKSNSVSVEPGESALGAYGGFSGSYWMSEKSRINMMLGYGGTGIDDYYGGFGPAFSIGASYLLSTGSTKKGIGFRLLYMRLKDEADADTRGEKGNYFALLFEMSFDVIK